MLTLKLNEAFISMFSGRRKQTNRQSNKARISKESFDAGGPFHSDLTLEPFRRPVLFIHAGCDTHAHGASHQRMNWAYGADS